jgi:MOSC domain-containing protein YiiM
MRFTIGPVLTGRPAPFRGEEQSAIFRSPSAGPVALGSLGLAGDEVADKIHHGGAEMAVHHYPHDHYGFWQEFLGGHELLGQPGALGENITTSGLTEEEVCIGDRFRLGTALVEVSQGRQPCWKIDHKFQRKGITAKVVETAKSGWYYRVIEPGMVAEGDALELVERPNDGWSVARVFRAVLHKGADTAELVGIARLETLSQVWRERALEKAVLQEQQSQQR